MTKDIELDAMQKICCKGEVFTLLRSIKNSTRFMLTNRSKDHKGNTVAYTSYIYIKEIGIDTLFPVMYNKKHLDMLGLTILLCDFNDVPYGLGY